MRERSSKEDKGLHSRNLHRQGYDFSRLSDAYPDLKRYVKIQQHGKKSIDFADPKAVKALNAALLECHYGVVGWDIPEGFLCPPVPGRVDYIHYVAELLGVVLSDKSSSVKMLDIGTGANGIYSLLAAKAYGWKCVGSDIDPLAIENVRKIVRLNPGLESRVSVRLQEDNAHVFKDVIVEGEDYDVSVCNPRFHASEEEALKASQRKVGNLTKEWQSAPVLNFGGQKAELWCKGGEIRFLRKMLKESKVFSGQCRWFTTLISKSENLQPCCKILRKLEATQVRVIEMRQGNKVTRVLAWTFMGAKV